MEQYEGLVFEAEFKVLEPVKRGRHSAIHRCISIKTGKMYAVKLQPKEHSSLLNEATIMQRIQEELKYSIDCGLPLCHYARRHQNLNVVVETEFGKSIGELLGACGGKFEHKTFLMVAEQMLRRVEFLHKQGYVHRCLSLGKFLLGLSDTKKLYLVGLGRAKRYCKEGKHIDYVQGKKSHTLPLLTSINGQMGFEHSRRDDLQTLIYLWVVLLRGQLPWQLENDPQKILSMKMQHRGQLLFPNYSTVLAELYDRVRSLGFAEEPDYDWIRGCLRELGSVWGVEADWQFEWQGDGLGK